MMTYYKQLPVVSAHVVAFKYAWRVAVQNKRLKSCFSAMLRTVPFSIPKLGSFISTVGGWFLPGQSPICPSSSPPQFSGTAGHSSGSYCDRYSSLRSHRAAPYPSHYPHRSSSTSKDPRIPVYISNCLQSRKAKPVGHWWKNHLDWLLCMFF